MRKSSTKKGKAHDTHRKTASKNTRGKTARKTAAENGRGSHHTTALRVGTDQLRDTRRFIADQLEEFRDAQVPATLRDLTERNIAQTRELYERSKETLQAILTSWQKSFGAANQGVVALNLKIMDIAERNIDTGFDFAMSLAGAKNVTEAMKLQSSYWQKQLGHLQTQAAELRSLSSRLTANVTAPIESQMSRATAESSRRKLR
jgi:hypothetical protein